MLVFGWGNRSRGDDALGPIFVERLRAALSPAQAAAIDWLDDYQLQPEHALDLAGRERVLFVDASLTARAPFEVSLPQPAPDASISTHALSPQALLHIYVDLFRHAPPPCTLLALRGERFGLGEPLGAAACGHLVGALRWATAWLAHGMPTRDA
jgi:hydrogenase maturation protease